MTAVHAGAGHGAVGPSDAVPRPSTRAVRPTGALEGEVAVPGDKSITHRAVMLNAIARGVAMVTGAGLGADCLSTAACMRALGATVQRRWPDGTLGDDLRRHPVTGAEARGGAELRVGVGIDGLHEPGDVLDAGNSGTTARLEWHPRRAVFFSVLTGDGSLRGRPMGRVVEPCVGWVPAWMGAAGERSSRWPSPQRSCARSPGTRGCQRTAQVLPAPGRALR